MVLSTDIVSRQVLLWDIDVSQRCLLVAAELPGECGVALCERWGLLAVIPSHEIYIRVMWDALPFTFR